MIQVPAQADTTSNPRSLQKDSLPIIAIRSHNRRGSTSNIANTRFSHLHDLHFFTRFWHDRILSSLPGGSRRWPGFAHSIFVRCKHTTHTIYDIRKNRTSLSGLCNNVMTCANFTLCSPCSFFTNIHYMSVWTIYGNISWNICCKRCTGRGGGLSWWQTKLGASDHHGIQKYSKSWDVWAGAEIKLCKNQFKCYY